VLQGKLGELLVSLCYQPTAECITVIVARARELKAKDINGLSGASRVRPGAGLNCMSLPVLQHWARVHETGACTAADEKARNVFSILVVVISPVGTISEKPLKLLPPDLIF